MKIHMDVDIDESKFQKTIEISKKAFLTAEAEHTVSPAEFLYQQSQYIKKHWWVLQALLLGALCLFLHFSESDIYIRRSMGVAAPLFVILLLPELWKNRNCDAMEVEGTTFYTIRQVYAARMTLFAGVDLVLLTLFFLGASFVTRLTLWEMMIQFVLPFNVSCCIAFRSLYARRIGSETFSVLLCSIWTGLWVLVVLKDDIYSAVSIPIWTILLAASFAYLGYSIYQGQKTIYRTWEAKPSWN